MKLSLAVGSLILFGLSLLFLVLLTRFESALLGISPESERVITLSGVVLPAFLGAALGVMSLLRNQGRTGLAVAGILLNTLFALFHLMIVLFAG
jgi:hypothetical protein